MNIDPEKLLVLVLIALLVLAEAPARDGSHSREMDGGGEEVHIRPSDRDERCIGRAAPTHHSPSR